MNSQEHQNEMPYNFYQSHSSLEKSLTDLEGILIGIAIDSKIKPAEINSLMSWHNSHLEYTDKHPFTEIFPMLLDALEDGILTQEEHADLLWLINNLKTDSSAYTIIHQGIQKLHGILKGILADGIVEKAEVRGLSNWLNENEHLQGCFPFDEINSAITGVLSDNIVTKEEQDLLRKLFEDYTSTITYKDGAVFVEETSIMGVCAIDPEIIIDNQTFCFTGFSNRMKRKDISSLITTLGGKFNGGISKNVDYLIVGSDSNPCWVFSCYGRKVEQAMNLRKKGLPITIVNEFDFWDTLEDIAPEMIPHK